MLGSALVPALVKAGHDISATDIDLAMPKPWGPDGPELAHLDVREQSDVTEAFSVYRPEFVAHLGNRHADQRIAASQMMVKKRKRRAQREAIEPQ